MHFKTHALVNCVAWFSLLCRAGNAAKAPAPSELLSHFARVGSALPPPVGNETPLRSNRSAAAASEAQSASRRQVDTLPVQPQEVNEPGGLPQSFAGNLGGGFPQQNYPYQFERAYQYSNRYPQFNQREQLTQNFFPGAGFNGQQLPNGFPVDPRFFQQQFAGNQQIGPAAGQGDGSKPLSVNLNNRNAVNGNLKDSVNNNVNTIQNLESSGVSGSNDGGGGGGGDSKSSAQNRPFDGQDFGAIPAGGQAGVGSLDPANGNIRVDNGYAINYERVRQNYYSDPPVNQQRYYSTFNEIPFGSGIGTGGASPFRSQLPERFSSGLGYNGDSSGRGVGGSSELRTGSGVSGLNDPYYANYFQGPYQSPNYNSIPAGNVGGGGGGVSGLGDGGNPASFDGFDGNANFRSPFNGIRYPGEFGGAGGFFPGGGGGIGAEQGGPGGFQDGEASLRGASSRESLSAAPQEGVEGGEENFQDSADRIDKSEKIKYVSGSGKQLNAEGTKRASS